MIKLSKTLKRVAPCPDSDDLLKTGTDMDSSKNVLKSKQISLNTKNTSSSQDYFAMEKNDNFYEYGLSFHLYMNRLLEYPRNEKANHLVTLADLTSSSSSEPQGILVTTFGFEKEFIKYLFDITKVL
jgi:hypothetical protein